MLVRDEQVARLLTSIEQAVDPQFDRPAIALAPKLPTVCGDTVHREMRSVPPKHAGIAGCRCLITIQGDRHWAKDMGRTAGDQLLVSVGFEQRPNRIGTPANSHASNVVRSVSSPETGSSGAITSIRCGLWCSWWHVSHKKFTSWRARCHQ